MNQPFWYGDERGCGPERAPAEGWAPKPPSHTIAEVGFIFPAAGFGAARGEEEPGRVGARSGE